MPPGDPVAAGVPADLLLQRPDVRAAGERLEAARFSIGARRAELLPSLSFSGTIGLQAAEVDGLFNVDQWFRNLIGNLTAPIFQGGRIRSNIALAHANFSQAAAAYGRTVVTAVHEVEGALAALDNEGRRHEFLQSQREEAMASVALQSERYASGVAGYTDYLDALRALLNVESTLAGARRDLALARLSVHRALGGEWTEPPETLEGAADGAWRRDRWVCRDRCNQWKPARRERIDESPSHSALAGRDSSGRCRHCPSSWSSSAPSLR